MLLTLFQEGGESGPNLEDMMPMFIAVETILIIMMFFLMVGFLKLGLKITKAPGKTGFKWAMGSVGIQVGMLAFAIMPLLLLGFGGYLGKFQDIVPFVIISIIVLLFLWINVINVLHRPGLGRSTLIFFLMVVGIVISVMIGVGLISAIFFRPTYTNIGGETILQAIIQFRY